MAETLPGLLLAQYQRVRWHLLNVGSDTEIHAVHFHGLPFTIHAKQEHRMGVYNLFPGKYICIFIFIYLVLLHSPRLYCSSSYDDTWTDASTEITDFFFYQLGLNTFLFAFPAMKHTFFMYCIAHQFIPPSSRCIWHGGDETPHGRHLAGGMHYWRLSAGWHEG